MKTPPPELPHPSEVRAALTNAQERATDEVLTLKRQYRRWFLVAAGAYVITLVGLGVALGFLYRQSGHIAELQKTQADNSANGRTLLQKVLSISEQIAAFSDPNSQAAKDQREKTAQALQQFDEAQRLGRADQLKKIAQMFEQCSRLPCDPAVVNRILAQPVPVPKFGTTSASAPATTMRSAGNPPASSAIPLVPLPSPTICPGIQVAPLNLARVCIPP